MGYSQPLRWFAPSRRPRNRLCLKPLTVKIAQIYWSNCLKWLYNQDPPQQQDHINHLREFFDVTWTDRPPPS